MDRYAAVGALGEGTYGTVAECVDGTTGRAVAVKRMRNTMRDGRHREMAVREVATLRRLDHDHVVPMVDAFRHRGRVHMVFPFMRCNLYAYLQEQNGGALTADEAKGCVYQVRAADRRSSRGRRGKRKFSKKSYDFTIRGGRTFSCKNTCFIKKIFSPNGEGGLPGQPIHFKSATGSIGAVGMAVGKSARELWMATIPLKKKFS